MYEIKNNINGKIYVGVHKTDDINDSYMGSGKAIKAAIKKYGIDNFTKVIIETFENAESMYTKERELVSEEFVGRNDTYNLAVGGSGGSILQNRKSWPKGKSRAPGTIKKMKSAATGRKASEKTKRKLSENNWSKRSPEEQRKHAVLAAKKRWEHECSECSLETKVKISESLKRTNATREGLHPLVGIKREKVKCPQCQKEGAMNTMSRFHFDNCKSMV
jgi:hypothetical protein